VRQAYIYDAVRTPRGRGNAKGSLHEVTAISLATQVLQALRDRNNLDTSLIDDVILGCVAPIGEQGANIARVAALNAGLAQTVAGVQMNRFCASGLEAVNTAAAKVVFGEADAAIGGGVESMSRVKMGSDGGAWSADPDVAFTTGFAPQGIGADAIATLAGFSRTDVDAFAAESQKRAAAAWAAGRFKNSIVPVKHAGVTVLDHDEFIRPDTTVETLSALKPSFAGLGAAGFDSVMRQRYPEIEVIDHVHHAGNSSGIVDGASGVLIGTKEMGEKMGLKPRARIVGSASIGSEPTIMLTGPVAVTQKALARAGMSIGDIDLFELNEAFASVVMYFMQQLKVSHDRMNVNGGAIAMGHPLGATGGMILGTLLDELERTDKATGLATLCVGAGMGTVTIIERV
jgi:acetyl-CoA C-acetyltransferase